MKRQNLSITEREEGKDYQLRGTVNIFTKIVEENFSTLKNEMTTSIKGGSEHQIGWTRKEIPPGT